MKDGIEKKRNSSKVLEIKSLELDEIIKTLRKNEEIARKFFEIEVSLLSILDFKGLFERLLGEIQKKFDVPLVWITLIDANEISDLIELLAASDSLGNRLNTVDSRVFLPLIENRTAPVLINEDLSSYAPLLPAKETSHIRSLAIAPITLHGRIIGSLNQADFSPLRFQPGIDTSLLEQLAVKVSICLSNVSAHERLKWLAVRDPLTGLLNRRVLESILEREFKRSNRYHTPLTIVFIDLDDFKSVNDCCGHACGDAFLKHVSCGLALTTRELDVLARYAGDEFVVIMPGTRGNEAQRFVKRLQLYFASNPMKWQEEVLPVAFSFGVASLPDPDIQDSDTLLRSADARLYHAKKMRKERPSVNDKKSEKL